MSNYRVQLKRNKAGKWFSRIVHRNTEIGWTSQTKYSRKIDALRPAERLAKALGTKVEEM